MKKIFGTLAAVAVLAVADFASSGSAQAKPAMIQATKNAWSADRAVTDVSARRYYRRYAYRGYYRPRYYRSYGYGYGYRPYYRPYGYRRPGIYLGF